MRRANDISQDSGFVPSPVVGKHKDARFGTHHARDAWHLFHTLGYDLNLFSSRDQAQHAVHAHDLLRHPRQAARRRSRRCIERIRANDRMAVTYKDSANSVFSFGRDHGHYGRILNVTRRGPADADGAQRRTEIVGYCFTPQDGNSLLSSVAAATWFLYPEDYEDADPVPQAVLPSARSDANSVQAPRSSRVPRRSSAGSDLEQVADDAVVGDLEDRGVGVLVDRDDHLRRRHPGEMLDGAGDPAGDVERRATRPCRSGRPGARARSSPRRRRRATPRPRRPGPSASSRTSAKFSGAFEAAPARRRRSDASATSSSRVPAARISTVRIAQRGGIDRAGRLDAARARADVLGGRKREDVRAQRGHDRPRAGASRSRAQALPEYTGRRPRSVPVGDRPRSRPDRSRRRCRGAPRRAAARSRPRRVPATSTTPRPRPAARPRPGSPRRPSARRARASARPRPVQPVGPVRPQPRGVRRRGSGPERQQRRPCPPSVGQARARRRAPRASARLIAPSRRSTKTRTLLAIRSPSLLRAADAPARVRPRPAAPATMRPACARGGSSSASQTTRGPAASSRIVEPELGRRLRARAASSSPA